MSSLNLVRADFSVIIFFAASMGLYVMEGVDSSFEDPFFFLLFLGLRGFL